MPLAALALALMATATAPAGAAGPGPAPIPPVLGGGATAAAAFLAPAVSGPTPPATVGPAAGAAHGVAEGPGGAAPSLAASQATVPAAPPDTARGRLIYRRGTGSASQPITAALAPPAPLDTSGTGVQVPATTLPCASCHGRDRRGRPEGGVSPSDITWSSLSSPAASGDPASRRRPAYTERLLKRAIALGIDAGGQPLQAAMPRYQMTQGEMADLIAYLETAAEPEPGVSGTEIAIGVLLPPPGELPAANRAVREALSGYAREVAARGGLYGRHLAFRFSDAPAEPAHLLAALKDLAASGVFALVAPYLAGAEDEAATATALGESEVPVLGILATRHLSATRDSRLFYWLDSGTAGAARALVRLAAERLGPPPPRSAIVQEDAASPEVSRTMAEECLHAGWPAPEVVALPLTGPGAGPAALGTLAARLQAGGTSFVFFLGPPARLAGFVAAAGPLAWTPRVLVPGPLGNPRSAAHLALAGAKVLVEAAKRAGRDLTRERLLAALDSLYRFQTGDAPAITFSSSRHDGVHGIPFTWLDLSARGGSDAEGAWIDLGDR